MKKISETLSFVKKHGLFPNTPVVESPHAPEVVVDGKKVLMFATNNYLGMMKDPRVIESAVEGVRKWGIGNGSARLLTGNLEIHNQLEAKIASFKKREAAISFVTGYMANAGSLPALANVYEPSLLSFMTGKTVKNRDTVFFSDENNHASIIAGIRLSKSEKVVYKHCDPVDLEEKLKAYPITHRKIIATDGVFSMDGDIAPLPQILELAEKYNAMTYVDDAHATGILGAHGRGIEDYFNVEGKTNVIMGTFTKAYGGVGGFVVSSQDVIDYLKISADSFIFTAPISPPVVYGLITAIDLVEKETWRREKLLENAKYLREKLNELKFNTGNSSTQIIPIIIGDEKEAMKLSQSLLERNIFVPVARWPAVPKGSARLRLTVTCEHSKEQIDVLVKNLGEIGRELGVVK